MKYRVGWLRTIHQAVDFGEIEADSIEHAAFEARLRYTNDPDRAERWFTMPGSESKTEVSVIAPHGQVYLNPREAGPDE